MLNKGNLRDRLVSERVISDGLLFQTLLARDQQNSKPVVLKRPQPDREIPQSDLSSILRSSFEATRYWKHPGILVPFAGYDHDGAFEIALRYINDDHRSSLTSDLLLRHAEEILPQLFSAIDFIHLMRFVHCDLKPENIFVVRSDGKLRLLITDLDLVRPIGSKPLGKIVGTRPFMAPEVLEDDIFVAQSDYYSLGVILFLLCHRDQSLRERLSGESAKQELAGITEAECDFVDDLKWLAPVVSELLVRHYQLRPPALLPLLTKLNPKLWPDRSTLERSLFLHDLRSSYRRYLAENPRGKSSPADFVRSNQRLFGIPDEILSTLAKDLGSKPKIQYRLLKKVADNSAIAVNAGRWNLLVPVGTARSTVEQLLVESGVNVTLEVQSLSRRALLRRAIKLEKSGNLLFAALWLERFLDSLPDQEKSALGVVIQLKIAHLLQVARFYDEADSRYRVLLEDKELLPRYRAVAMRGLVDLYRFSIDRKRLYSILGQIYGIYRKRKFDLGRLQIVLNMTWRLDSRTRIENAYRRLRKIEQFLMSNQSRTFRLTAGSMLGQIEYRMGNPDAAVKTFTKALEVYGKVDSLASASVRAGLVVPLSDTGRYHEAYKETEKYLLLPSTKRDVRRRLRPYLHMTTIAGIIGDYQSAEFTANKLLESALASNDAAAVAYHSFELGWLYLRSGRYNESRDRFRSAADSYQEMGNKIELAKTHMFLSLLLGWRGQIDIARNLIQRSAAILSEHSEPIDALDARQFALHIEYEAGAKVDVAEAVDIINDYVSRRSYLGAAFTASLLLLDGEYAVVDSIVTQDESFHAYCRDSGAIIGKALLLHLKSSKTAAKGGDNVQLAPMRETLLFYRKYGYFYHAANIANQLGELYRNLGKAQLARGFFAEAARLYTIVGNRVRTDMAKSQLDALDEAGNSVAAKYKSMLEVSELLNSFEDYSTTTSKLLTFAVEQTGAERAALLLATEGGADLRIESAIDCDKISRDDILTMSKSVMKAVFDKNEALIVTDAQTNSITREYRSVIKHNIYSIACVPLMSAGGIIGVLYLDHHSLPSVFSEDEYKLVTAVANFIGVALSRARQYDLSRRQTHALELRGASNDAGVSFITKNASLAKLIDRLPQIADSRAAILLLGESGTGKDVLANIIHQKSPYHNGPLIPINCAGAAGEILESELFGIGKGIATGVIRREGKIQSADGGTLFLDEIGDMPIATQIKLLRVLETREVQMIGERQSRKVDFRLIAATNRDLVAMMANERFRSDLYYRINTVEIVLPPLRERIEDLELLIDHFTQIYCPGRRFKFTRSCWKLLNDYHWPGNVREVRHLVERLKIHSNSDVINESLLSSEILGAKPRPKETHLRSHVSDSEKALITKTLAECQGNQSETARRLGIPFSTLQRKIKNLKIRVPRKRR